MGSLNEKNNRELIQTYVSDEERRTFSVDSTPFGDETPDMQMRSSFAQSLLENKKQKPAKPVKPKKEKKEKKKPVSDIPSGAETTSRAVRFIVAGAFVAALAGVCVWAATKMDFTAPKNAVKQPETVVSETQLPTEPELIPEDESGDAASIETTAGEQEEGSALLLATDATGGEEMVVTTAEVTTTTPAPTTEMTTPAPTTVQTTMPTTMQSFAVPQTTVMRTTTTTTRRTIGSTVRTSGVAGTTTALYPVVHIENITLPATYGDGYMDAQAAMWIINQLRVSAGVPELDFTDDGLINVSRNRIVEACGSFDAGSTNISKFSDCLKRESVSFHYCCECLVGGAYSAEQAVGEWLNNPTNSMNIYDARMNTATVICTTSAKGLPVWIFEAIAY